MDLAIRELTSKLIAEINSSTLPIEVKRLIMKDICEKVTKTADNIVMQAIQERNEQLNKETKQGKSQELEGVTKK